MDIDINKFVGANVFYLIFIADEEKQRVCVLGDRARKEGLCV